MPAPRPPGRGDTTERLSTLRSEPILALSLMLSSATTPAEVSDAIMAGSAAAFADSVGTIIARRRKQEDDQLEIFAVSELPGEVFENWQQFRLDADAPLAEAVRNAEVVALESPEVWRCRYPHLVELLNQTGHQAQLIAPMIVGGAATGAIGIAFDKPRAFSEDDKRIATSIASQCAIALERVRLFDLEREGRNKAESANKAKSQFLASLSHELRTPMNAIGGYVQLMEMGVHGPVTDDQKTALHRIQSIQRHINGLIESVLEFSRIEAGAIHYNVSRVMLADCLRECEDLIATQLSEKDIRYECTNDLPSLAVSADEPKLRQILVNLLVNAIKYNRHGGRIVLTVESDDRCAYLRISDTGPGIHREDLDSVFEPFMRVQSGGSIKDGVGLGLPISRSLARGMGGDLTVESTPGHGSTFCLSIPFADA